jgi:hypothetical protein
MLLARSKIGLTGLTAPNKLSQTRIASNRTSILAGKIGGKDFAFLDRREKLSIISVEV